jgi:hypothetical protein
MVSLKKLVLLELTNGQRKCKLIVRNDGAWWFPIMELYEVVKHCEHRFGGLVSDDSDSSQK